jgi:hypothetical protein
MNQIEVRGEAPPSTAEAKALAREMGGTTTTADDDLLRQDA